MPIYTYKCATCGERQEVFNKIDARDANPPHCCDMPTDRQLDAPMGIVKADCHYVCPVTGAQVTSYRQRANIMAKEGLRDGNDYKPAETIARQKKKTADRQALASQLTQIEGMSKHQVLEAVS